jgi:hypothetical protein
MRFMLEQATYLMGMMSAHLSKTGKVGVIGGVEIPPLKSTFLAFEAGAKSVRPDFQVVVTYIGNWDDVGAAKQAAHALIEQNCDVIFPNADAASLGAFQAAQEKVLALGANKNRTTLLQTWSLQAASLISLRHSCKLLKKFRRKTFKDILCVWV